MTRLDTSNIHPSKLWRSLGALALVAACLAGFETIYAAHGGQHRGGTITGRVTDPSGMPIEGVVVSIRRGPSTVTEAGGGYTLDGVKQKRRIVVDFSKEDFVPTQGITSLRTGGDEDDDSPRHRLGRATLDRTMLPSGATHMLDSSAGGTITEEGFKVTFPPGSLNATGAVEVIISPIDVSTAELQAFPGDFIARAADGSRVLLETFSLMEITILQNGQVVPLRRGSTATLEFLLPENTSLTVGETVALWYFDEVRGLWIEDGSGTVGVSSFDPGRFSVLGTVSHFTWWNADRPINERTCLTGTVLDANGNPTAGASVFAQGIDYNGTSFAATDANGAYCVTVKRASQVSVTATVFGGFASSASVTVAAPDVQALCGVNACTPVPTLTLPAASCVSGDVRDALDNAVAGITVTSSTGGFATTAANGAYCLSAPAGSSVTAFASGFNPTTVTTSASPADCASGVCAVAPIRPPSGGNSACLQVSVTDGAGGPADSANVQVFDGFEQNIAGGTTDAAGNLCLSGLPVTTDIFVEAIDSQGQSGGSSTNTGTGGGSCSTVGCVQVPISIGGGEES